ncbi:MAG: exodeoxyribonuclease V subunit gamma, partial [Bryobacterales bacterium]|nr:exodeoxyribonuclease V subunit gamma [Bryobacterales bacterium]
MIRSRSNGRLLQAAASFVSRHPEVLAIVPGRLAGERLEQAASGSLGLHRITLIQLAAALARPAMAERGLAPIGILALEAVAARVANEALKARELKYFEPVAALPGFARALGKTLGELRLARITPEDLSSRGPAAADLAKLLLRYQDELHARSLADLATVLELATEMANAGENRLIGVPVLLLDVPLENGAHREFFQAVAARSREVLAAIAGEDSGENSPASTLRHLRRYLFSQSPARSRSKAGFEMFSAPGEGLEAVEIARRILRIAAEGVALDEIAILLRSPERYQPMVEEALRRARIPAWFSRGTARPDPAGRAFLALLACASEKCSASRFAEYLSLGQVPSETEQIHDWVPPQDEILAAAAIGGAGTSARAGPPGPAMPSQDAQPGSGDPPHPPTPAAWEKLLVDAAVIGGRARWVRRLNGLEREFELKLAVAEKDETHREYLAMQLERLRSLRGFALPLIERLDNLPASAVWSEWIEHLTDLAEAALRNPQGVLAVLAELEPMGDVGPVSVDEVAEVLSERLRFLRAEPPQRRWGRVFVGSIDEVRGCEFPVVFLPGLAEGLFPQRAFEDSLLLDDVRRDLSGDLPLRQDRSTDERERLHLAVAAARDRFIASYPRMDVAEARPRVPSFYALELPRAIEGALPNLAEFEERARNAAPARLNWPAPPQTEEAIDDAEFDLATLGQKKHARYLLEANPHVARSLRARWERWNRTWKPSDGMVVQNTAALEALGANRLTARAWSPSSLEQFSVCPYKFALQGIYRLRPREDTAPLEQLDPLTRGGLFHEVQRRLLAELKAGQLLPLDREHRPEGLTAALERCNHVLDTVAAEYKEMFAPAIERVWNSEIEDLRTDLRGWLQHAAQNDSDWEPLHFEFSFGLENREGRDPASVPDQIELAEGVHLRGAIDLVERHRGSGVLRVTDHKSGKAPDRVPLCVNAGRSLQPVLYGLAAEKIFGSRVEYGRLFYATQRGDYRHMAIALNDRARLVIAQLLQNIDGSISSG